MDKDQTERSVSEARMDGILHREDGLLVERQGKFAVITFQSSDDPRFIETLRRIVK